MTFLESLPPGSMPVHACQFSTQSRTLGFSKVSSIAQVDQSTILLELDGHDMLLHTVDYTLQGTHNEQQTLSKHLQAGSITCMLMGQVPQQTIDWVCTSYSCCCLHVRYAIAYM